MRVLLLHPEDSPRRGPWTEQRWDLVVDMGKSSAFSEKAWEEQLGCPVLRLDSFRRGVADLKLIGEMFSVGRGRLLDDEGIDWWDLTSVLIAEEVEKVVVLQRMASEISPSAELWATRSGWPINALSAVAGRPVRAVGGNRFGRLASPVTRYAGLLRRFSMVQIRQIFLDKYDSGYQWRSRFASREEALSEPTILLPSAYENVSRMAVSYARLMPAQSFLLVATRQSATQVEIPSNVHLRELATYATADLPTRETASILGDWRGLQADLCSVREFKVLSKAGVFEQFASWFRDCLRTRNAWREVLEREPVQGVLCGDDSNIYTRLPVLLAARRQISTVDFHHGAFDGRYVFKTLPCDLYLAKSEMEQDYLTRVCGLPVGQVVVGAPLGEHAGSASGPDQPAKTSVVFFSEPYETAGMRPEEVYRELLPPLCRVARESGRELIIKLHPFENRTQRRRMVREMLSPEDEKHVTVLEGPLTKGLMLRTWFGITVESTTVMECQQNGICCFLCEWLKLTSYEYMQQYARYSVGEILQNAKQIDDIPRRLAAWKDRPVRLPDITTTVDVAMLQRWLTARSGEPIGVRSTS
jgi:hypothetical protein